MASTPTHGSKVPVVNGDDKADWPTVGFRVSPEDRKHIDRAAIESDMKRSEFLHIAAIEKAEAVLAEVS